MSQLLIFNYFSLFLIKFYLILLIIILIININYDLWKIITNSNKNWNYSYENNIIYSYSDLFKEIKYVNSKKSIIFIFILFYCKIVFSWIIINAFFHFILFIIKFYFFKNIKLNLTIKNKKIIYIIMVCMPKILAYTVFIRILKKTPLTKKEIKTILINLNSILLFFNNRNLLNITLYLTNIYFNIDLHNNSITIWKKWKKTLHFAYNVKIKPLFD